MDASMWARDARWEMGSCNAMMTQVVALTEPRSISQSYSMFVHSP